MTDMEHGFGGVGIPFEGPPTGVHYPLRWIIPVAVLVPALVIVIVIVSVILWRRRKKQTAKSRISNTELHRLSRIDRTRNATSLQYSDSLRIGPLRVNLPPHCAGRPGCRDTYCMDNETAEDLSGGYSPLDEFDPSGIQAPTKGATVSGNNESDQDFIPSDGLIPMTEADEYDHIPAPNAAAAKMNAANKQQNGQEVNGLMANGGEYDHIPSATHAVVNKPPNGSAEIMMSDNDEYDHIPNVVNANVKVINKSADKAKTPALTSTGDEYDHILNMKPANVTVIKTPEDGASTTNLMESGDEYDHIPVTIPANATVVSKSQDGLMETDSEYDHISMAPPTEVTVIKKAQDDDDDDEAFGLMANDGEYDHIPGAIPGQVTVVNKPTDKGLFRGKPRFLVKDEGGVNDESDTEESDNDDDEDDNDDDDDESFGPMADDDDDRIPGAIPGQVTVVNTPADKGPFGGKPRFLVKDEGGANDESDTGESDEDDDKNLEAGNEHKVVTPKVLVNDNNLYEGLPEPSTPVIDPNNSAKDPTRLSAQKYSHTYSNCVVSEGGKSSQGDNKEAASVRQSGGTNETRSEAKDESFGYVTDDDSVFYRSHEYLHDDEEDIFVELEEGGGRGGDGGGVATPQVVVGGHDLSQKTGDLSPRTAKVMVVDNDLYSSSESDVDESTL